MLDIQGAKHNPYLFVMLPAPFNKRSTEATQPTLGDSLSFLIILQHIQTPSRYFSHSPSWPLPLLLLRRRACRRYSDLA